MLQDACTREQGARLPAEVSANRQLQHEASPAGSEQVHAEGAEAACSPQGTDPAAAEGRPLAPAEKECTDLQHLQGHRVRASIPVRPSLHKTPVALIHQIPSLENVLHTAAAQQVLV